MVVHDSQVRSMGRVDVFRDRLNSLYALFGQIAVRNGANSERKIVPQEPFSAQMSTGGTAALPVMRVVKGQVEVSLRPSEISAAPQGSYYATLSVGRRLLGAGRLDSPSCWTDLDNTEDANWYAGGYGDKSKPVDAALMVSWLLHSGPTPIW